VPENKGGSAGQEAIQKSQKRKHSASTEPARQALPGEEKRARINSPTSDKLIKSLGSAVLQNKIDAFVADVDLGIINDKSSIDHFLRSFDPVDQFKIINGRDRQGFCAMIKAAECNDLELMVLLKKKGASLNVVDRDGVDLAWYASHHKNDDMAKFIEKYRAPSKREAPTAKKFLINKSVQAGASFLLSADLRTRDRVPAPPLLQQMLRNARLESLQRHLHAGWQSSSGDRFIPVRTSGRGVFTKESRRRDSDVERPASPFPASLIER